MDKAKVAREYILYVGDSGVDMQTAQNAHVDAVGVSWGFRPRAELQSFSPLGIIDRAEELMNYVL
jgi:phosphoglycolate phosphatase